MFEISRTFTSHCKKIVCFFLAGLRRIIRRIVVFSYLNAFIQCSWFVFRCIFPRIFTMTFEDSRITVTIFTQGAVAKQKQHSAILILIFLISWRRPVKRRFKIIFNFRKIPRKKKKIFLIFIFLASSGFYYNFFVETWRWFSFWAKTFFWLRILERGRSAFSLNPFKTIM